MVVKFEDRKMEREKATEAQLEVSRINMKVVEGQKRRLCNLSRGSTWLLMKKHEVCISLCEIIMQS
jgi:hypothetical protein